MIVCGALILRMNTQIFETIQPATKYVFITVPQDGVRYRFENKSPYTIYICAGAVAGLPSAKSANFAIVQAGQMHEFSGRYSAPFEVWSDDAIDFAYSTSVRTTITLTTNLQGESSYVATLPIAGRSDDTGLDSIYPTATRALSTGTDLSIIDMEGYAGLSISWNISVTNFVSLSLFDSYDGISFTSLAAYVGQSSQIYIPRNKRYIKITVTGQSPAGTADVTFQLNVYRLKYPLAPLNQRIDPDSYSVTIPAGAASNFRVPLKQKYQKVRLSLFNGTTRTLVKVSGNPAEYVALNPGRPEEVMIFSDAEQILNISNINTDAAIRTLGIQIFDVERPREDKNSDIYCYYWTPKTLTNAAPAPTITVAFNGYDWIIFDGSPLGFAAGVVQELVFRDLLSGNTLPISVTTATPFRKAMRIWNDHPTGVSFQLDATGLAAGATIPIRVSLAKGNILPVVL